MQDGGLDQEIRRVASYLHSNRANAPCNELETRERVVRPLLVAAGYAEDDIRTEAANLGGSVPDYTLLPGTPNRWYLEVKPWGMALTHEDAIPVVHHAEAQGSEWAVLTNGQEWRLYHATDSSRPTAQRRVAAAHLSDQQSLRVLLEHLSKKSVTSGGLEHLTLRRRLAGVLSPSTLTQPSEVTDLLAKHCQREGIEGVLASDVAEYFRDLLCTRARRRSAQEQGVPIARETPFLTSNQHETWSLVQLAEARPNPTNSRPVVLILPDETQMEVHTWKEVLVDVVKYVQAGASPVGLPIKTTRGRKVLADSQSFHLDLKPMRQPVEVNVSGSVIYVETHRSAHDCCRQLERLLHKAAIPPESVRVVIHR